MIINVTDIFFDGMAVAGVFVFLLAYSEWLAYEVGQQHGRRAGYATLVMLLIVPTALLAWYNWKLAAAGWALRAVIGAVSKIWGPGVYRDKPNAIPSDVLTAALATDLTGDALANDILARCKARGINLGDAPKR